MRYFNRLLTGLWAIAIVTGSYGINVDSATNTPYFVITVLYAGADVPGTYNQQQQYISMTGISNLAGLASAITTNVRTTGQSLGYTIPANSVFIPNYIAQ